MKPQNANPPAPPVLLDYARADAASGTPTPAVFWVLFCILGALCSLPAFVMLGELSPSAIVLQLAFVAWLTAAILHLLKNRFQHAVAAAWVTMLWLLLFARVAHRLWYWLTIGMEAPDGTGSPLAFLMGFGFEIALIVPFTLLGFLLLPSKPWRIPPRLSPC